jgi:hypothetical protein
VTNVEFEVLEGSGVKDMFCRVGNLRASYGTAFAVTPSLIA